LKLAFAALEPMDDGNGSPPDRRLASADTLFARSGTQGRRAVAV